ncbi:ubiquinol-cytochrome c reductase iron-sulfur subunit [Nitriliruptor alkaliphilus]|uniref:QcrA and Rieske domain-containing protein n=1 Tax=Nitriliruptor alkaliphilus TaxID=427918 RepID=UPI000696AC26|nr:Rieske 2Fe-2S domain-containing protein [Nitriliruptor alkaliphilus]
MVSGPAVTRRSFLRYSLGGAVGTGLGGFALGSLGFLYPRPGDELTGPHALGAAADLVSELVATRIPIRVPAGGVSLVLWDPTREAQAATYGRDHAVLGDVGLMALYTQRCVHLGCAVPWCQTSQWWECPCHGSRYNRLGEWVRGPAPRGLDRYASSIDDAGTLIVDFGDLRTGPARTARSLEQPQEGPNCTDA